MYTSSLCSQVVNAAIPFEVHVPHLGKLPVWPVGNKYISIEIIPQVSSEILTLGGVRGCFPYWVHGLHTNILIVGCVGSITEILHSNLGVPVQFLCKTSDL